MKRAGLRALVCAMFLLVFGVAAASAAPYHVMLPGYYPQPPTIDQCQAARGIECYGPSQVRKAYDMQPLYRAGLNGAGKTIVIVDSFGSPTIQNDLQQFDQAYHLPSPPSFNIITPDGPVNQNDPAAFGWGVETTLDVEWAHTMAPGANILLVETPVAETEGITGFPEIVAAENYVIDHHLGDVITQSFGATEQTFSSPQQLESQRGAYFNALSHRVTVLASSGDTGAANYQLNGSDLFGFPTVGWPASDPLVTGVGGLRLQLNEAGDRIAPDSVWNDPTPPCSSQPCAAGGGLSSVFDRPSYQDGVARVVGGDRGIPDVSLNAAVSSSVVLYMSFDGLKPGFYTVAGTSEASPLFSGIVAIADQAAHRDLGLLNPRLYGLGSNETGLVDITRGNNTVTFQQPSTGQTITVHGYSATPGYDLASGLGEPDGARLVAQLAGFRAGEHRG